jgi:hypothetical protein
MQKSEKKSLLEKPHLYNNILRKNNYRKLFLHSTVHDRIFINTYFNISNRYMYVQEKTGYFTVGMQRKNFFTSFFLLFIKTVKI